MSKFLKVHAYVKAIRPVRSLLKEEKILKELPKKWEEACVKAN